MKFYSRIKKYINPGKILVLTLMLVFSCSMFVFAAEGDPVTTKFMSLQNLTANIISAIGQIVTLWAIFEWGMAYQSSEGTMQSQAFKRIGGGMVMVLAPQLLPLLI